MLASDSDSVTDVHINRAPVAGEVVDVFTERGGYSKVSAPEAEHNAACYTVLSTARGRVVVAQRTGALLRRIVNRTKPGAAVAKGERYGLIRFGSRTDVYLPAGAAEAAVVPGEEIRVTAQGLPEGVKCPEVVIGPGANSATLVFRAEDKAADWAGVIQVVGKAKVGDKEVSREARGGTVLYSIPPAVGAPPGHAIRNALQAAYGGGASAATSVRPALAVTSAPISVSLRTTSSLPL